MTRTLLSFLLAFALTVPALPAAAHGHPPPHPGAVSELSALSMLPVAVSVAAPIGLLSAGAALGVVAVEAAADGTVWILERASDGARASLAFSGALAGGASLAAGTVVVCMALSAGWVLSAAGHAIAFIPNEIGKALLYNERITR